ncbi:carbamate kinase [Candidatus Woesearchaeota archaeon]|nr:carbamate kinase [Candidatus Woesearchaeota archaeon]
MKPIAVVALGGNALIEKSEDIRAQELQARKAMTALVHLHQRYDLVVTHGNGPQVGNLLLRSEVAGTKAYHVPLDYCVAQSQGEIGYLLSQAIEYVFAKRVRVVTVLTRVTVSQKDHAFAHPSKPIGDFYSVEKTAEWKTRHIPYVSDAGRGYRRVVPSPMPRGIHEAEAIMTLTKSGHIVIAVGGGGIPVSNSQGIEAVIDKDAASALLATSIKAERLIILTAADAVYLDYLSPARRKVTALTVAECRKHLAAGQFPAGSMGPKIMAALSFLQHGGSSVLITDPEHVELALKGKAGTLVVR